MTSPRIVRVADVMKKEFDLVDGKLTVREALLSMKYPETRSLIIHKRDSDDEAKSFGGRPITRSGQSVRDHGQAGPKRSPGNEYPLLCSLPRTIWCHACTRHQQR